MTILAGQMENIRRACSNSERERERQILEVEIPKEEGSKISTSLATLLRSVAVYVQTQYFFELSRISERAEGRLRAADDVLNASFIWSPWESVKPSSLLCGSSSLLA